MLLILTGCQDRTDREVSTAAYVHSPLIILSVSGNGHRLFFVPQLKGILQ